MTDIRSFNPDVLSCLANLSNDEVFTPPKLANEMLDLLPPALWSDKNARFLDPCSKTGVFLREIAKRLLKGLEPAIPDVHERINHIFKNQIYGIAITELTAHLTRRSVYCSKHASGKYSVCTVFEDDAGNIRFERREHAWKDGKCTFCGASQENYDRGGELETHAYEFIHTKNCEELFKMKFDVIVGNPPYQLGVGNEGGNSSKAKAIYHHFISQAMKLNPRYLTMIVPSRWMTRSTEGIPDEWVDTMLNDRSIKVIHDFLDARGIFSGTPPKGGINYFLWDREYNGKCHYVLYMNSSDNNPSINDDYIDSRNAGIVIRDVKSLSIIDKIKNVEKNYIKEDGMNFSGLVSPKDFFTNKEVLTSSWKGYSSTKNGEYTIKIYLNKSIHKISFGWIKESDIPKHKGSLKLHKVYIPAAAQGDIMESDNQILGYPFYGEPNSVCSQTYLVIGYDSEKHNFSELYCKNIISYIKTKFFRYMVSIKKKTQNGPRQVYQFVPMQDFSEPWTDEKLYAKYGITAEEQAFIESMIRPMEVENE